MSQNTNKHTQLQRHTDPPQSRFPITSQTTLFHSPDRRAVQVRLDLMSRICSSPKTHSGLPDRNMHPPCSPCHHSQSRQRKLTVLTTQHPSTQSQIASGSPGRSAPVANRTRPSWSAPDERTESACGMKRISTLSTARRSESGQSSNAGPVELNEEEQLLLKLKEEENLPWKDIAVRFQSDLGKSYQVPALQMRFKRLRERMRTWTDTDVSSLLDF